MEQARDFYDLTHNLKENGMSRNNIKLALVGAGGRGGSFRSSVELVPGLSLYALCDINEEGLKKAAESMGVEEEKTFTDYEQMLDQAKPDAVLIGTPMPLHVPQAVAALQRDIHVLSEVPAAISLEECHALVTAEKASNATYMMAENYIYSQSNQVVLEMVRRGLFGEIYYGEGEYLHELKGLNEITFWRRHWQNGIDGITYGTHSLGPLLQWFEGERIVRVCCAGSGHHYLDPRNEPYAQDTSVMLGQLSNGGLVKIRVDMISNRPHAMTNYQLQGTTGCYEAPRAASEKPRIWLKDRCADGEWLDLTEIWDDFLPERWKTFAQEAAAAGHGGGDLLEMFDFVEAIHGIRQSPIGIHEAMDMTIPGLVSQQAIKTGVWLDVPDSRDW